MVPVHVVLAMQRLGARVDLHSDRLLRLDLCGERWTLRRTDSMTLLDAGDGVTKVSARPLEAAVRLALVGMAERARQSRGLEPFPSGFPLLRGRRRRGTQELRTMGAVVRGVPRWTTVGEPLQQLTGPRALGWFRYADGRTTKELLRLLTSGFPSI